MSQKEQSKKTLIDSIGKKLTSFLGIEKTTDTAASRKGKSKKTDAAQVMKWQEPYTEVEPTSDDQRELQEQLRGYVIDHISDPDLNVIDMAKAMNVSRTALFGLMHEAFGMTPISYVTEKRLAYALDLIRMGQKVNVVAKRCGYADAKYFGKVFKRRFGILPSKLSRTCRLLPTLKTDA